MGERPDKKLEALKQQLSAFGRTHPIPVVPKRASRTTTTGGQE